MRRRGQVIADRHHATIIRSPKQTRHELSYVLDDRRHHREDLERPARRARIDPYSSAIGFGGRVERDGVPFAWPRGYEPLPVSYPMTWLLAVGWRRAGPAPSLAHVP